MKAAAAFAFASLLLAASASPQPGRTAGERAFLKCYSCHALEPGKNDLSGPTLHGIVGRPVAAEPAFDYSPALLRFAKSHPVWSEALLDRFAADPEAVVPGTSMAFHGMRDPNERAALIAFLKHSPFGANTQTPPNP